MFTKSKSEKVYYFSDLYYMHQVALIWWAKFCYKYLTGSGQ